VAQGRRILSHPEPQYHVMTGFRVPVEGN
jgi:hypothetical protein